MYSNRRYYFLTVAETLNITRAAEHLCVSQPSLTQYLNKLENELGVKLLDRKFSPLRLTQAGQIYYNYLLKSRKQDEDLVRELDSLRLGENMPLNIGIPMQKCSDIVNEFLPRFIKENPDINISIWEGTSGTVKSRLEKGDIDIGFCHVLKEKDSEFITDVISREKIVLICNSESFAANGQKTSLDKPGEADVKLLNDHLFFQMGPEYLLYEIGENLLAKNNIHPKHRLVMSNLYSICSAVAENGSNGFAFMPDYVFNDARAAACMEHLAFLRLGNEDVNWMFAMVRKRDKNLNRNGTVFWRTVEETYCHH